MNEMSRIMRTAKLFWTGRSQAVRLPKDFRFEGSEVCIRREDDGSVNISPARGIDDDWISRLSGSWDEDAAIAALDRPGPETMPEGPHFD